MRERELGQSSGEGPSTPPASGRTEPTMDLHFGTEMREDGEDVEEMEERCSYRESPAPPLPGTIVSPRGFDMNQIPSADEMEEEEEAIDSSTRRSGSGGGYSGIEEEEKWPAAKKKLRLTGEQSAVLEESFKQRSTLNSKEKLDLAEELKLHPRQVEVWFQNRRARTKMKQTEEECEYMKRCCETLRAENRRLLKELEALRALETGSTCASSICPSCRRAAAAAALCSKPSSYSFAFDMTAEQQHLPPEN